MTQFTERAVERMGAVCGWSALILVLALLDSWEDRVFMVVFVLPSFAVYGVGYLVGYLVAAFALPGARARDAVVAAEMAARAVKRKAEEERRVMAWYRLKGDPTRWLGFVDPDKPRADVAEVLAYRLNGTWTDGGATMRSYAEGVLRREGLLSDMKSLQDTRPLQ